ncbi:MAG: cyclic pyranopterin monophosphate synthase MoaC [Candidatus Riflebacteria bacterium]|nr:cyclic pyranopterin monophosphate synthase MoaC [Candidatus Riflebacteria bacterium]
MSITHLDSDGRARMVDIGSKNETNRCAIAFGMIRVGSIAMEKLKSGTLSKGDAFSVSRIAGILAAKKTNELIPLTHPIGLSYIQLHFAPIAPDSVCVFSEAHAHDRTGVEMEAMTALSVALLNLYDMVKGVTKGATIECSKLLFKSGGKSGTWLSQDVESGKVEKLAISKSKGTPKEPRDEAFLKPEFGLLDDAHAGNWHRQVSLLGLESITTMKDKGLEVGFGSFAENICTSGIKLYELPIGTLIFSGDGCILEVTQIGKECHTKCAVYYKAGDCVMPREGIFARVLSGGTIKTGDRIIALHRNVPELSGG